MSACYCNTVTHERGVLGCAYQLTTTQETVLPMSSFLGPMCTHASGLKCDICSPPLPETVYLRGQLLAAGADVARLRHALNKIVSSAPPCRDPDCDRCSSRIARAALEGTTPGGATALNMPALLELADAAKEYAGGGVAMMRLRAAVAALEGT